MANQSAKRNKLESQKANQYNMTLIGVVSVIYFLIQSYYYFIKKIPIERNQIISCVLAYIINYILYRALDFLRESMWKSYLDNILELNLLIQLLSIYSWKFWMLYPAILSVIAGKYVFAYVSTIGKVDPNEIQEKEISKKDKKKEKEKQKIKYVKH